MRNCVRFCAERGVKVVTVFAFSSENWQRPADEVSYLMGLLVQALRREIPEFQRSGLRVRFVGSRDALSDEVSACIEEAEQATAGNDTLVLNVCFNYGGRWDIVQAAARLAARQATINEQSLAAELALAHVSDPDLIIRTGGEKRMSNFLLWQAAYAELYFSEKLWPDFGASELEAAFLEFAGRERRFGKTSTQVNSMPIAAA